SKRPRCLFFFSSRRRHTRWPRDWSSDVCSSDLIQQAASYLAASPWAIRRLLMRRVLPYVKIGKRFNITREDLDTWVDAERAKKKIGRASCRERVEMRGVSGSKKKANEKR